MEKLDEETIRRIELDVSQTLIQKGIRPTRLTFDTTNFYTHIEHGENLPKKGFSKDERYDKNLIGVGLTTSNKNIPFQTITYPANVPDSTLFSDLKEGELQLNFRALGVKLIIFLWSNSPSYPKSFNNMKLSETMKEEGLTLPE